MKKLSVALHCCVLALATAACGENDSLDNDDTNNGDETSEETTEEETSESETADAGGPSAAEVKAILDVKAYITAELEALHEAAVELQAAAPEPDEDGWDVEEDEEAIENMRAAWRRARSAYEQVEGAIAVLFPQYDESTDQRYDGFIEVESDENLFDGEIVTGVHAIERILWAGEHPETVVEFEKALPNYIEANFPTTLRESTDFVDSLAQLLVDDTAAMVEQFEPLALDAPSAFRGVIGSMQEQTEKVALATTGEDESRYAQYTLGDMRANAAGGRKIFEAFIPWLEAQGSDGEALAEKIGEKFDAVEAYYAKLEGDAIPAVPSTWNEQDPSEEDLATEYGKLHTFLSEASDPEADGSLVQLMLEAADLLGIAEIPE